MQKLAQQSGLGIMLRIILLFLVIVVNSSEETTIESPLTGPSDAEELQHTSERSSVNVPTTLPLTSFAVNAEINDVSSPSSQTKDVEYPTPSSWYGSHHLQTIQDYLSELASDVSTGQSSTESFTLDTTIWVWQKFSWTWVTILQIIISLIGIVGNLLVIVVMGVRKSTASSTDIFIGALAVSDMLTSVFNIPVPRALQVADSVLGRVYCGIIFTGFLSWICVISSTYILVGASFERLAAVVYPLRFKDIVTNRRVSVFITVVWLFSFLSCSYYIVSVFVSTDVAASIYCAPAESESLGLNIITSINFAIRLVIPTILLMGSQITMAISLHLQSSRLQGAMSQSSKQSYHILARNRIIKMMLVVVIIFILCWAPSQITFVIVSFSGSQRAYIQGSLIHVRKSLNLITFINSSINPFIYAAHYPKFRSAIKEIFMGNMQKNVPLFSTELTKTSMCEDA